MSELRDYTPFEESPPPTRTIKEMQEGYYHYQPTKTDVLTPLNQLHLVMELDPKKPPKEEPPTEPSLLITPDAATPQPASDSLITGEATVFEATIPQITSQPDTHPQKPMSMTRRHFIHNLRQFLRRGHSA